MSDCGVFIHVDELLEGFMGDQGPDTLGVPLFDNERMTDIWETQKKHVQCIQDPEGVSLCTQTGTCKKGDVVLPKKVGKLPIPEVERKWIAKALCRYNQHGVLEVRPIQLWYHPPKASSYPFTTP